MSGATTEQIIRTVERRIYTTQLIALTILRDSHKAYQLLNIGLSGYVLKDTAFEDLLTAIKQIRTGKKFISPSLTEEKQSFDTIVDKPHLTDREIKVLSCVVKGDSNQKIAFSLGITQRTVCFHMSNCFTKLEVSNRTQAIVQAACYGLVDIG